MIAELAELFMNTKGVATTPFGVLIRMFKYHTLGVLHT